MNLAHWASDETILCDTHDEGYVDELNINLQFVSRWHTWQKQQWMVILLISYGRRVRLWLVSNQKKIPFRGRWSVASAIDMEL